MDENIADLVTRLKAKQYKPQPVLRVYIPKPNGDKRPLVMPSAMLVHSRLSRTRLSRWGKFKLGRKTSPEEVQTEDDGYEYRLKRIRNHIKLNEWWKVLRLKLLGH